MRVAKFVVLLAALAGSAFCAGTKEEAKALVKAAIVDFKAQGEAIFPKITAKDAKYVKDDLYVTVYDMNGKCVAHGANVKQVGKDLIGLKDPDGVAFVKERVEMAKTKGSGWQDYKFSNPVDKKIEQKTAYLEKSGEFIFSCGAYSK
ncbi:MAG: cache domain-containing protein [Fibrobacterota bacterium]|nr:cache domain-containing protein [Fibrobacterota bacterium]QQS07338.1 MAG: cache domain-containing protein [Fibrobacterota bacterium]